MKCNFCIYVPSRAKLAKRTQITWEKVSVWPWAICNCGKSWSEWSAIFLSQKQVVDLVIDIFFRDYCYAVTYLSWSLVIKIRSAVKRENFCQDVRHNIEEKQLGSIGCFQLRNLDFDFGFRISDFPIKSESKNGFRRTEIPLPRWISIKRP